MNIFGHAAVIFRVADDGTTYFPGGLLENDVRHKNEPCDAFFFLSSSRAMERGFSV